MEACWGLLMDLVVFLRPWRKSRDAASVGLSCVVMRFALLVLFGVLLGVRSEIVAGDYADRMGIRRDSLSNILESPSSLVSTTIAQKFQKQDELTTRKLTAQEPTGNALQLKLIHRNALESPTRKHFASTEKEIFETLQFDAARIAGFHAVISSHRQRLNVDKRSLRSQNSLSDAPAPSPSPGLLTDSLSSIDAPPGLTQITEFQSRLISGALLPGNIGQYFVEFYIGTPGQRLLFIADTGSDLVWVPCSLCQTCSTSQASGDPFFPQNSSTFTPITCSSRDCDLVPAPASATCSARSPVSCTYAYVYSDSSETTGIFAFETVTMTSSSGKRVRIKNVAIGCGTNNTGPSVTKLGGVIGLGQGPISFPSQVGHIYGNKFSYCLKSFFNRRGSSGALAFGDELIIGTKLRQPFQHTSFVHNPLAVTFYYLAIEAVRIGRNQVLPIPPSIWEIDRNGNGGVIIDSGTTLSYLRTSAYDMLIQTFESTITYPRAPPTAGLPLCYNVSGVSNPKFPSLSILFRDNAIFQPPSSNYFLAPTIDVRCLAFLSSPAISILGNLIQQNFYVEYDGRNNRLGFARAHCSAGQAH